MITQRDDTWDNQGTRDLPFAHRNSSISSAEKGPALLPDSQLPPPPRARLLTGTVFVTIKNTSLCPYLGYSSSLSCSSRNPCDPLPGANGAIIPALLPRPEEARPPGYGSPGYGSHKNHGAPLPLLIAI